MDSRSESILSAQNDRWVEWGGISDIAVKNFTAKIAKEIGRMTVLTSDRGFEKYPIDVIWCGKLG